MKTVQLLIRLYTVLCVAALVLIAVLRNNPAAVTPAVWVRATIVTASALVMTWFAARAIRGEARARLRLRIVSAIVLVAIVVIVALPGVFPVWFRIEQAVCGLPLLGAVILVNARR